MSLYRPLLLALTATSLIATPVAAAPSRGSPRFLAGAMALAGFEGQRPRDQDRAFRNTREGRSMPLPMIKQRVEPHMGGASYIGPEIKGETYRLKYMQDGRVIWVDVDASTGRILRRSSGN
jgi:hypothetical protein